MMRNNSIVAMESDNSSNNQSENPLLGKRTTRQQTRRVLGDITNNGQHVFPVEADAKRNTSSRLQPSTAGENVTVAPTIESRVPTLPTPPIIARQNVSVAPLPMPAESMEREQNNHRALIETRNYMLRESDDIDSRDNGNQLLCTQYVNQMYVYFKAKEADYMPSPTFLLSQKFINEKMRCILFDWLVDVHLRFKMVPETLFLTVNIIDRYLQLDHEVRKSKLQLVGVAAMLLASKYEEIYPPELTDLVFITDHAYKERDIIEMEGIIATALGYNLTVPTVHTFLCRYLKAAHADRPMVQMACYLAERTLQEYRMVGYKPSLIAATAIHAARITLGRHPWSPTLVRYTEYDEHHLEACSNDLRAIVAETRDSSHNAVYRKYSSSKFGSVARMEVTV